MLFTDDCPPVLVSRMDDPEALFKQWCLEVLKLIIQQLRGERSCE